MGALLGALAVLVFVKGALAPGICVAFVAFAALGAPLPLLLGEVRIDARGLRTKRDVADRKAAAWTEITALRVRRNVWTESVEAVRDDGSSMLLGAPVRSRLGRDPAFDAAVAGLARRAGVTAERGPGSLTGRWVVTRALFIGVWAFVLVAVDPLWHHPVWPGRPEARTLPDACAVSGPVARSAFPRSSPERSSSADESGCEWGDGLTLRYSRYEYAVGRDGGIEQAKGRFLDGPGGPTPGAEGARAVPDAGDEAVMLVSAQGKTRATVTQIQISVRRANVLIWLVYTPPRGLDAPAEASRTAERLAREAAAAVVVE
ncbi:hypothetical protein [Spirillospora sp. NPDC047279]|uniref:hypothetical protein n=1 Tax=Spirillospora sp. NPDC047279 TaxID=3155478 RepID=UPI0033D7DA9D